MTNDPVSGPRRDTLDISRRRGGFALGPFSLAPFEREVTVVIGENGAGKSTLFESLVAVHRARGLRVASLPQTFALPPYCRLADACALVAERRLEAGAAERRAEIERALTLTGLADQARHRLRTLSGGMQRRAGICLTLIGDPHLLILDEPTAGLDLGQRESLLRVIGDVARTTPVVMSSHIQEDLESTATRVILLVAGQLRYDGPRSGFEAFATPGARAPWVSAYRNLIDREGAA